MLCKSYIRQTQRDQKRRQKKQPVPKKGPIMNRSLADPALVNGRDPMDGIIVYASTGKNGGPNAGLGDNNIQVLWPPPENGIVPSPPGAVMDECPGLVSSDEEEGDFVAPSDYDELVRRWMLLNNKKEEVEKIKHQGVGLFLLGMESCAPPVWVRAMIQAGVFQSSEKIFNLDAMDDKALLLAEIAEEIFKRIRPIFFQKNKKLMRDALAMIDDIEKNGLSAEVIEVPRALQIAMQCDFFNEEWNKLKEAEKVQKFIRQYVVQPVLFSLLFFYKLVHHHVIYYGSHKGTKADKIVHDLYNKEVYNITVAKEEGNKYFRNKEYGEAVKMYSVAMIKDYGNPIVYGNRAQCYIYQKDYRRAYCDSRRAIFLNPTWPKAHYRCALACFFMGQLEEAMRRNEFARQACRDSKDLHKDASKLRDLLMDILKQRVKIIQEFETKGVLTVEWDLSKMREESQAIMEQLSKKHAILTGDQDRDSKAIIETVAKLDQTTTTANTPTTSKDKAKGKGESESGKNGLRHPPQHPPRPVELTDADKFTLNLREALEAYNLDNFVRATGKYQAALNLWNHSHSLENVYRGESMMLVRYGFGITAVSQKGQRTVIQEGLQMFQAMHKDNVHKDFPLVLYGLGRAFVALFRFSQALEVVKVQVSKHMKKVWKEYCWPGSEQTIEESKLPFFMSQMAKLKELSQHPPQPDAVCFQHDEHDNEPRDIYKDSPTYTGMVTMSCFARCVFVFHIHCWKEFRGQFSAEKLSEKEMIDMLCPTPDCGSFIFHIVKERPDKKNLEFQSEQRPVKEQGSHKVGRMQPSNPDKIARRRERKEVKEQKRAEARQTEHKQQSPSPSSALTIIHSLLSDPSCHTDSHQDDNGASAPVPASNPMVLLYNKEGEKGDVKYNSFHKQVRQKKKKEKETKTKNVLNLDFNFNDDVEREANRFGEQEAIDNQGNQGNAPVRWEKPPRLSAPQQVSQPQPQPDNNVFAVPPHLREQCESFSNIVASKPSRNPSQSQKEEDIKSTFNAYLYNFLREAGPQDIEGPRLIQELEDIPEEVIRVIKQFGGKRRYFETNSEFTVIGNFVGVREDAEKVKRCAKELYDPPLVSRSSVMNGALSDSFKPPNSNNVCVQPQETSDSNHTLLTSQTCDSYPPETASARLGDHTKQRVRETHMTLPAPSISDQGLNPTAPEFQPSWSSKPEQPTTNGCDTDEESSSSYKSSNNRWYNGVDSLDNFSSSPITNGDMDDIDDCDVNEMDMIDEVDIQPSVSTAYIDLDDITAGRQAASAQDGLSRRSSRSDLSQTSDLSTGALFRGASPSSSVSSHKGAPSRDVGSPFSARDTSSPGVLQSTARNGDMYRKTGSPAALSFPPSSTEEADSSELGLGESFVTNIVLSSRQNDHMLSDSTDRTHNSSAPKPLKPLTLRGGSASGMRDAGSSAESVGTSAPNASISAPVGSLSATFRDAAAPIGSVSAPVIVENVVTSGRVSASSGLSKIPSSSSLPLSSSFSSSALDTGLSSFSFSSTLSNPWGSPSLSTTDTSSAWPTNTFPSSVRPDEQVTVPPFCTASLYPKAPPASSTSAVPPPISFPSFSSSAWPTESGWSAPNHNWSATEPSLPCKVEKMEVGSQVSVDVRSAEVNTEMTERDIAAFFVQQEKLVEMHQQMQHLHMMYEQSQQQLKTVKEEKALVKRDADVLKGDLNKAVQQMSNMDAEYSRAKEHEQQLHKNVQSLQQQNQMSTIETQGLLQKVSHMDEQLNKERTRAKQAECQVIREQMENFKMNIDRKIKEAEVYRIQASSNAKSYQDANPGQPMPKHLEECQAYTQQVIEAWTTKKTDIMTQLKEQQEQIMAGRLRSDMPPIDVYPALPRPPEGLHLQFHRLMHHPQKPGSNHNGQLPVADLQRHSPPRSALPAPEPPVDSSTCDTMATSVGQLRPVGTGPPGFSTQRPPAPLRPPLSLPGMPLTRPPIFTTGTQPLISIPLLATPAEPAPPPLRPIGTGIGIASQPRPLTPPLSASPLPTHRPALLSGTPPPLRPVGSVSMRPIGTPRPATSFDKMVMVLQKSFPHCDREHFQRAIQELRQAHNGSLTGLDLEFIITHVTRMLIARGFKPQGAPVGNLNSNNSNSSEWRRVAPPPGLSAAWSVEGIEPFAGDRFVEEEDPCAICHEELTAAPILTLECMHRYHDQCIRTWFKQSATCPKCRTYTPLLDDFPTLK
ncbi:E3 ubiquitin-protein ligase TTC3-like isoform X3 [Littorina saxatilis]|uniref:E3 ubiquitin-protein ligase TTC3-like isoform X3 n=1 Tax=Littorina saxatilis TaxID=31220 RepID=UPI0038B591AF